MRKLALLLAALAAFFVAPSAHAQFGYPTMSGNPWWPSVLSPPARFAHPYAGQLIVKEVDHATLQSICASSVDVLGCTYGAHNGSCTVYLDSRFHDTVRPALLAHEVAHCNGWNRTHSN